MTDIARSQRVSFDVTDPDGFAVIMISVGFPDALDFETVFDGDDFTFRYDTSTQTVIADGFTFDIARNDGWHAPPIILIVAVDAFGNLTRETITYGLDGGLSTQTDLDAIATRVGELLEGAGSARTISAGFTPLKVSDEGEAIKALQATRVNQGPRYRVTARERGDHSDAPPVPSDAGLVSVEVTVRSYFPLTHSGRNYAARLAAENLAKETAGAIRDALEWPGNMRATEAGALTRLLSGMLMHVAPDPDPVEFITDKVIELTQRFTGIVKETRPI